VTIEFMLIYITIKKIILSRHWCYVNRLHFTNLLTPCNFGLWLMFFVQVSDVTLSNLAVQCPKLSKLVSTFRCCPTPKLSGV